MLLLSLLVIVVVVRGAGRIFDVVADVAIMLSPDCKKMAVSRLFQQQQLLINQLVITVVLQWL